MSAATTAIKFAVESGYFKVIGIKKGLQIIRIHTEREGKNMNDRSGMFYKGG